MNRIVALTKKERRILSGTKVFLEPFCEKYITDAYIAWFNDSVVCRYNSHGETTYDRAQAMEYFAHIKAAESTIVFAICVEPEGSHIGNISLNNISRRNRSAEISIIIGEKDCWGGGFGTEAFRLIIDYGFNVLNLHRLWIGMTTDNAGMIRIAEKLGFKEEGRFRDALLKNGAFKDITQWALLNPKK